MFSHAARARRARGLWRMAHVNRDIEICGVADRCPLRGRRRPVRQTRGNSQRCSDDERKRTTPAVRCPRIAHLSSKGNLLRVSDTRFECRCKTFASPIGRVKPCYHGLAAFSTCAVMVRVAVIAVAKAILRRREDRGGKIPPFQLAPPGKISRPEVGVLLYAIYPPLHDENLLDAVFVLDDVTEFMGAHCNYAHFGMLAPAHDLAKQRISKHDAAIVPAQGRIFGGESIQLHAFRKRKARQYRKCFADFE